MFGIFDGRREAEQVAVAINQVVLALSHAETTGGVAACIEFLQKVGQLSNDTTDKNGRYIKAKIEILRHDFYVHLLVNQPEPFLMITGGQRYAGFKLSCALPPRTFIAEVQPSLALGASRRAHILVSAIQEMTTTG